jgi:hypothetical protein
VPAMGMAGDAGINNPAAEMVILNEVKDLLRG